MPVEGIYQNEESRRLEKQQHRENTQAVERQNLSEKSQEQAGRIYQSRSEAHREDIDKNRQRAKGEVDTTV